MPHPFPSALRKFVRVPAEEAYKALSQILEEPSGGKPEEENLFKAKVGKGVGVSLKIRLIPEGEAASLEIKFHYRGLILLISAALAASIGLSLLASSLAPLALGAVATPILIYRAGSNIEEFLKYFDDVLRGLESEYARRKLMEDRIRWQRSPKNVNHLYEKLRERQIKIWGSTYILEYKIKEYQRLGLTREEAIRKIAEEEGVS